MRQRQTRLVAAVRAPIAYVGGRDGDAELLQRLMPAAGAAAGGLRCGRTGDMVDGFVPLAEQVVDDSRGTAVLVGVDGGAVVGGALVDQHEGQFLGRLEVVEIGDALLQHDDDAVHRQLLHPLRNGLQRADVTVSDGDQRGCVTIVLGGLHDAVQDAGVAECGHMEEHDADVPELPVLERPGGVVGAVPESLHRGFDALPRLRTHGVAAVRHAGDGLWGYACGSGHVLHGHR